jgi:hypothetical protein
MASGNMLVVWGVHAIQFHIVSKGIINHREIKCELPSTSGRLFSLCRYHAMVSVINLSSKKYRYCKLITNEHEIPISAINLSI